MSRCPKSTFGHQYKLVDSYTKAGKKGVILFVFVYRCKCGDEYESVE